MNRDDVAALLDRDDVLSFNVYENRRSLVVVCEGDGSIEKLRVAHIPSLDANVNKALATSGYRDGFELARLTNDELVAIDGIGPKAAKEIQEAL